MKPRLVPRPREGEEAPSETDEEILEEVRIVIEVMKEMARYAEKRLGEIGHKSAAGGVGV